MKRFYIVGLNTQEAQGYAMRFKREHRGHQVRILSAQSAVQGGLRGLAGEDTEVTILPRTWRHPAAVSLGRQIEDLELHGVRVITTINEGDEQV